MNRIRLPFTRAIAATFGIVAWTSANAEDAFKTIGEAAASAVDVGDFGSDEPVERRDQPSRGVIVFGPKAHVYTNQAHWDQFDWKFTAKRWGHYQVRLTYTLKHATLGAQFKMGEQRLRKILTATVQPKRAFFGELFVDQPGDYPFALYTAASGAGAGFEILEMAFVPTKEGDEIKQAEDGAITLLAKDATTWSENMRYEPKAGKNCLGYWTDPDDFAEWEFEVTKPGRFKVSVFQGCGGGNGGSRVAVKLAGQELKFTVQDTGGFQNWAEVQVGELEIKEPGTARLIIDPENKTKAAVLDVQKIVLQPVG